MTILLALLGLALGSFLNVLIFRYEPDKKFTLKTAGGRSRCLHCGKTLHWYELVPLVSWIVQLGKCRNCKGKISLQYPIVELAAGALCVFVPRVLSDLFFQVGGPGTGEWVLYGTSALWIVIFLMLIAAFFIDVRYYIIPNYLNLAVFLSGIVWVVIGHVLLFGEAFTKGSFLGSYADLLSLRGSGGFWGSFLCNHIFGMVVGAGFFLLVIFLTRGKAMGMGDAKLMAGIGLLFGYPDVLIILALSFVLGTLYALPLLISHRKGMKDMLPFGPFIVLAVLAVFFFGNSILAGYFGILEHMGFGL